MNLETVNFDLQPQQSAPLALHARVVVLSGECTAIEINGKTYLARRAFSCIIQPLPGDLVLYTKTDCGSYYILGIIERPGEQHMTMAFPGKTTMRCDAGPMNVLSSESMTVAAGEKLTFLADQTIHKSREAVVDYGELTARGKTIQASFESIRVVSQLVNTIAKLAINKFKNYIRHTEEQDQIKAKSMGREVEGLYTMDSKYTVMVSKKDTKIDGERIHMG